MTILGTCPECGLPAPLETFMADAEARRALAAALALPAPLAERIPAYLALFAPGKRKLQIGRLARLLEEFVALLAAGTVTRGGDTRPASLALWGEGLTAVLAARAGGTLDLPLKSHGLLCEIVHRRAGRAGAATDAAPRPLHPSHRAYVAEDGPRPAADTSSIQERRAQVADLLGERTRLLRLARYGLPSAADQRDLAYCEERLRALGIAPGGEAGGHPRRQSGLDQPQEQP